MPYEPRWYIEEALDATFNFFNEVGGTNPDGSPVEANPVVAMPTGTGKSYFIAEFVRRAMLRFPQTRLIMSTHVKELIDQNVKRMLDVWPNAPIGIHSAGLKSRETLQPIIFGGIKSMLKNTTALGHRDLCVIDEAHLVSPNAETGYQTFLTELKMRNPYLKVILLTATPYRLGLGHLTNGNIATHVAYDLCNIEGFSRLIAEGYLCPVTAKKTQTQLDLGSIGVSNATGDFVEGALQEAIDQHAITFSALTEICNFGRDRRAWMIFAAGIEHAEHIALMLRGSFGVPAAAVHSKMKRTEVDQIVEDFKSGRIRCIVNKDILTTGFDHPPIDLIGMLRPTMSPGLWVQMLGRGMRPFPMKENCLVLDFAANTARLGPVNDPNVPMPKGAGPPRDSPVKLCKVCGTYNHSSRRTCEGCGEEFPFETGLEPNINAEASNEELLRSALPQVEWFDVGRVVYDRHTSKTGSVSVKVAYYCEKLRTFYEYIKFEDAKPFAIHKAHDWLRQRTVYADQAIEYMASEFMAGKRNDYVLQGSINFRIPKRVNIWVNKPDGPQVMGYEF